MVKIIPCVGKVFVENDGLFPSKRRNIDEKQFATRISVSSEGQYKSYYYCSPAEYFGDKVNFKLGALPYTVTFQIVELQGHRM